MQAEHQARAHPLAGVESAKAWFQALPLTNPQAALDAVNKALSALMASDYAGSGAVNTLQVLEAVREPMTGLSRELSWRYAGRPLPLAHTQHTAFESNITLAWTLAYLYYSLIEPAARVRDLEKKRALIHQRALSWMAHGMEDHLRAGQAFAGEDWDLAQSVLQSADRHELLEAKVRDNLAPDGAETPRAAYTRLLLLHLAGARSLAAREFETARELAQGLSGDVGLTYAFVDRPGQQGKQRSVRAGELIHYLDTDKLARQIEERRTRLDKGKMFDSPPLANPLPLPALSALLGKLHNAWCARVNLRQAPREPGEGEVFAAFEPVGLYGLLKLRQYVAPPPSKVYNHHEVADIYLARGDGGKHNQASTAETWNQVKPQLETWRVQDQSATGMRLTRRSGGARMRQGQLMALRPDASGDATLAIVRWATQSRQAKADQQGAQDLLEVGVQMLPGLARAGAVRHTGTRALTQAGSGTIASTPVLILDEPSASPQAKASPAKPAAGGLPSIAMPDQPQSGPPRFSPEATILLPTGWAREGEEIEFIDGDQVIKLRLGALSQRLGDMERMKFKVAS